MNGRAQGPQGCVAWGQRGGVRDSRSSWAMLVHGHGDWGE